MDASGRPSTSDRGSDDRAASTRRTAAVGVPIVLGAGVAGGVWFALPDDGSGSVRSDRVVAAAEPLIAPPTTALLFEPADPTLPASTPTTLPATTIPPATTTPATASTTVAPSTVPSTTVADTPDEPIAPPSDPRGFEEQVEIGGIAIPTLGVDEPLLEGIRLTTLDNGPGHWPGTAMPGDDGNVVVAAHRTSHGGPFRHIDQLQVGDPVVFTTDGDAIEYRVTDVFVVEPDALWIVDQTDDATATLFACHPPGSVAQRIVVKLALTA